MRIPAVLVIPVIAILFAWTYGPAWAVFGAAVVIAFAVLGIRRARRSPGGDGGTPVAALPACSGGATAGGCGDGGTGACGGDGGCGV